MITVLTVNDNTLDFLKFLVQSVRTFRRQLPLIKLYQSEPRRRLIAAKGGVEKPIRRCVDGSIS